MLIRPCLITGTWAAKFLGKGHLRHSGATTGVDITIPGSQLGRGCMQEGNERWRLEAQLEPLARQRQGILLILHFLFFCCFSQQMRLLGLVGPTDYNWMNSFSRVVQMPVRNMDGLCRDVILGTSGQ